MRRKRRILVGAMLVFAFQFIISIFFGRIFCGWMCPGGAYQEAFCSHMNGKNPNPKVDKVKFVSWAIWIAALIVLAILVGGIKKINFFYGTYFTRSVDVWGVYFIIYSIVALVIFLSASIVGKRGFCHIFCWMAPFMIIGSKIGRRLHVPQLRLEADAKQCTGCKKCEKNCKMGLDAAGMVREEKMDHPNASYAENALRNVRKRSFSIRSKEDGDRCNTKTFFSDLREKVDNFSFLYYYYIVNVCTIIYTAAKPPSIEGYGRKYKWKRSYR